MKNDEGWLAGQHSLVSQLRRVWVSEAFQERHRKDNMAATNWKEPKLLAYCLLSYCKYDQDILNVDQSHGYAEICMIILTEFIFGC